MSEPLGWLVEMLTQAWGEPKVAPPAEPSGRHVYRSEVDGLIWVKLADKSRRAWVWFPGGVNSNLSVDKGSIYTVSFGGAYRSAEVRSHELTWAGLTRETLEPLARYVYGLVSADA
jgi:hypothetical protein